MQPFTPGQRWISNAELSLGLGTLIESGQRTLTIHFIASDEIRTYAQQNAPLTRIIYAVDEQVETIDGLSICISQLEENEGLIRYYGVDKQGQQHTVEEMQLSHNIQLNRPAERLFIGQIDKSHCFNLRYQTLKKINQLNHDELFGLTGCRTNFIAHQIYIAHEVARRYAPRVLLADEVGLGKTIEAGLIIHQQLLTERAQRVLIVVPESLMHQWLVEMLRRFNLMFSIFDKQRCQSIIDDSNPFLSAQLILCSVEFLAQNNDYHQQLVNAEWDLLVVDEAHHLHWSAEQASHEYLLIEQLSQKIRGVLLLTATPEQLGIDSHFARLRLLDADRFPDLEQFIAEEKSYQPIAQAMAALLTEKTLEQGIVDTIRQFMPEQFSQNKLHRKEIISHLLDRHGTGRILFRNTRATISGFADRAVIAHPQPLPERYVQALQHFTQVFVSKNTRTDDDESLFSNLLLYPELLYQLENENNKQTVSWTQIDPRVSWLAQFLIAQKQLSFDTNTNSKTLVICANASTTIDLATTLKQQFGIYAAVFHEQLSLIERDRAAAFFADHDNGAPVLVCSEIGSEGRNFQFAQQMVLFDLPLNPDLLEQRIGRLDRIGQTAKIKIHVPYLQNSAQELLFHWYHKGLNAFERTCPAGHKIFTQIYSQLCRTLLAISHTEQQKATISTALAALIDNTQRQHQQLNQALHLGRDRLLEYNSCRQPEADQLKERAEHSYPAEELHSYMENLFAALGIDHVEHSEHCYIISPGEHMLNPFPGLPEDGMTITYQRHIALANEDIQFFTWEHPLVRTAMDMVHSSEMGNTALTTVAASGLNIQLPAGSLLLECLFVLETSAHQNLQANRYLPASNIRIMVDEYGTELSGQIRHNEIGDTKAIKKQLGQQIIKIKEPQLRTMITYAEQQCQQQVPQLLDEAKTMSAQILNTEIERLQALAQVNPNIRIEEIDFFAQQLKSLDSIFNAVSPRLDALRLIIVT